MRLLPALFCAMVIASAYTVAHAMPADTSDSAVVENNNNVEAREYHFPNARVPGPVSARQDVMAWQVTQGSWNGQTLDSLCLVLVHSVSDDGSSPPQMICYVSDYASPSQRQALLAAFLANNPKAFSSRKAVAVRVEPAVITLQMDGQTVVLHLGLVA